MRYIMIFVLFIIGIVIIPKIAGNFSQPLAGVILFSLFALLLFLLNKIKPNNEPKIHTASPPVIEKFSTCPDCGKTFYDSDFPNKLCPDCGKPLES